MRCGATRARIDYFEFTRAAGEDEECENCGKREFARERKLKRCARCKVVLYCSEKCQKEDWHHHKESCKPCEDPKSLPKCGLCGNGKGPFTRTECCKRLVCDDEGSYRMMSYSRIHCVRNHRRYSICGHHHAEGHKGKWQNCKKCKKDHDAKKRVSYDYASRAGNPFKFNFDQDVVEFDWPRIKFPKCDSCRRAIDTMMENFIRCFACHGSFQCDKCVTKRKNTCPCLPKMHVTNSVDKY